MTLTLAHVSDLHLGDRPEAASRIARVVDHLVRMDPRPDVLVVTGDIADHGEPGEYAEVRDLLARWPGPLLLGPGNHDAREPFARALLGRSADGPLDRALEVAGHRLLMLDSLVPARDGVRIDHGELAPETLAWLDDQLASDDRPTFVCLHHPPASIGVPEADAVGLQDPEALAAVLARHDHHVATLVGHNHVAVATTFAGRPMLVGGGVVSSVTLDAEPMPHVWDDAPPTLALHLRLDDGRLVTHWRALPEPGDAG